MATKISELTATSSSEVASATDVLPLVNAGATKKITVDNLLAAATLAKIGGVSSTTPVDGNALVWSESNSNWEPGSAGATSLNGLSDVSASNPELNQVISWDGSSWVSAEPTADVDTPLNAALRGTDNPHIGAYPNQSFKVTDNPYRSVMVIADADGNLDFVVKTDDANIFLNTPSARKAASFGFSVVEDSSEPDIEVAGTLGGSVENYSVISGDSDTKGVNGLPLRQGFNNPDIGAYPAPILISGGTIA